MRRLGAMLVAIGVLGLAGCGGSRPDQPAAAESRPTPLAREPAERAKPEPPPRSAPSPVAKEPQQEQPAREPTRAELAREVAKEVCSISTISELANEFGVPSELAAVVAAYAEGSTPDAQIASEQGCLEGLTE